MADVSTIGQAVPMYMTNQDETLVASLETNAGDGRNYLFTKTVITGQSPATNTVTFSTKCLNGSSESMAVNGSVTPVNFDAAPTSSQIWNVTAIYFLVSNNATATPTNFAGLAALTNGVRCQAIINSNAYDLFNVKNNQDIIAVMPVIQSYSFAQLLGSIFAIAGGFLPSVPIVLNAANSDRIRFTVRDNLSSLNSGISVVQYYRSV